MFKCYLMKNIGRVGRKDGLWKLQEGAAFEVGLERWLRFFRVKMEGQALQEYKAVLRERGVGAQELCTGNEEQPHLAEE